MGERRANSGVLGSRGPAVPSAPVEETRRWQRPGWSCYSGPATPWPAARRGGRRRRVGRHLRGWAGTGSCFPSRRSHCTARPGAPANPLAIF